MPVMRLRKSLYMGIAASVVIALSGCKADKPPQKIVWTTYYVPGPECDPPHKCDKHGFLIASPEAKRMVAKSCPDANPLYVEMRGACPASAIKAQRATTVQQGVVHESAVLRQQQTPEHSSSHHPRDPDNG